MWGMSVRFSHLPDYPAPTLDSLPLVLSPSPALPLTPSHVIIYSLELVCLHFWMKMSQFIWSRISSIRVEKKEILKNPKKTLAVRWPQLHSKASCDAPSPVSHSIINKPYVPYLSMTNTMGRWGISQSDGSDSRAKLSSKTKKALFWQTRRTKDTRQLCRVPVVPTFENGGPLLVPHLFELPSEVPRRERIQGQAGKAPQDGLVQSLRALRLTLSHVPHGSLLRRQVGRRRALRCSYHSSMWSLPPDSPYFSTRVSECFSSLLQNNLPFKQEGQKNLF